jgi:hypothetical protein
MTPLRERLQALLESALAEMVAAETAEPGLLRLAADCAIVLAVLDDVSRETKSATGDDTDGRGHARVA